MIEQLRKMTRTLRTTSFPLADVIPLLQEAADEIERLKAELGDLPEAQAYLLSECKRLQELNIQLMSNSK